MFNCLTGDHSMRSAPTHLPMNRCLLRSHHQTTTTPTPPRLCHHKCANFGLALFNCGMFALALFNSYCFVACGRIHTSFTTTTTPPLHLHHHNCATTTVPSTTTTTPLHSFHNNNYNTNNSNNNHNNDDDDDTPDDVSFCLADGPRADQGYTFEPSSHKAWHPRPRAAAAAFPCLHLLQHQVPL